MNTKERKKMRRFTKDEIVEMYEVHHDYTVEELAAKYEVTVVSAKNLFLRLAKQGLKINLKPSGKNTAFHRAIAEIKSL